MIDSHSRCQPTPTPQLWATSCSRSATKVPRAPCKTKPTTNPKHMHLSQLQFILIHGLFPIPSAPTVREQQMNRHHLQQKPQKNIEADLHTAEHQPLIQPKQSTSPVDDTETAASASTHGQRDGQDCVAIWSIPPLETFPVLTTAAIQLQAHTSLIPFFPPGNNSNSGSPKFPLQSMMPVTNNNRHVSAHKICHTLLAPGSPMSMTTTGNNSNIGSSLITPKSKGQFRWIRISTLSSPISLPVTDRPIYTTTTHDDGRNTGKTIAVTQTFQYITTSYNRHYPYTQALKDTNHNRNHLNENITKPIRTHNT